jgi:predicted DNA-binding transcriptional regulator AlpA
MPIAIAKNHSHQEEPEKLPICRFPLPPNLLEFAAKNITVAQQRPVKDTAIPTSEALERDDDNLLNARQVAERLGVSERWVRDHTTRRAPRIRGVKLGMMMRYRRADIDFFLQKLGT